MGMKNYEFHIQELAMSIISSSLVIKAADKATVNSLRTGPCEISSTQI